ncbi:ComEC/Rec2 family competence protein [Mycolicibacterium madagascariense]|uniref:ComEC/Rec2 family competence protein n=1 Tax=Mycolicibacterium madagascariense TaxID=212765 RepID=UPI0013D1E35B|nr:ComEC/Rec2 family competence protein [Mycolicibacterium madagascariense]MCV7015909.1 ComEC/Rec2 family competence protein [Mycolicibacterium madagascariense]
MSAPTSAPAAAPTDAVAPDVRLVPAAVTGWAVTAAGIVWGSSGAIVVTVAAVVVAAVVAWRLPAGSTSAVLAVAVIGIGFAVAVALRVDRVHHHPIASRHGATVTVAPTESPRYVNGRMMFRANLIDVDGERSDGRVVVFAPAFDFADVTAGRPATFRARVSRPTRRDLSVAVLTATGRPRLGTASTAQRAAQAVRTRFAEAARAVLPADEAAMLPALVLGDTSAVDQDTSAQFRSAGLTHLTAVSGANVTIVCGAVLLTAGLLGPRIAVALAAVVLVAFVVVVQPSASVLRAAAMGAIALLAVIVRRRRRPIPALSACVLLLLAAAPELAVDAGFALSVSATAAIVVVAPAWTHRLRDRGWPAPLAAAVSVTGAAQLVTAPLVAGLSGSVSLVSVVTNVAVSVVVAPITVIGTAAATLAVPWPWAAELAIRFTGPELWWLLHVARWAAAVPGATVSVPSGWPGVAIVAAVGVAGVGLWRVRRGRIVVLAAVACLVAWALTSSGRDEV